MLKKAIINSFLPLNVLEMIIGRPAREKRKTIDTGWSNVALRTRAILDRIFFTFSHPPKATKER